MNSFNHPIENISLAEFDLGGVLYHARYFNLYEQGREALLRKLDFSYPKLVAMGYHLAVTESSQKFHAPVCYGDELRLELKITELSPHKVVFEYFVYKLDKCLHHGITKHAVVEKKDDGSGFKISKLPKELSQAFENFLAKSQA